MGSFLGHAWPGTIFLMISIWWSYQTFKRYLHCRRLRIPFYSTVTHRCMSCESIPVEPTAKIFVTIVGIIGEIITGRMNREIGANNWQHVTMFSLFLISGVVDIFIHFRFPLPKYTDYAILLLATAVEGVLFAFHLHGRSKYDIQVHTLLVIVIKFTFCAILAEIRYPEYVMTSLSRIFGFFVQGSWFWQTGFLLYSPIPGASHGNGDDHKSMMMVAVYFSWHCAAAFVIIAVIGVLVAAFDGKIGYRRVNENADDNISVDSYA